MVCRQCNPTSRAAAGATSAPQRVRSRRRGGDLTLERCSLDK